MTDYIKRIQSNLTGKKIKLSRPAIREELELLGYTNESLTSELTESVINTLVQKFSNEAEPKLLPDCEPIISSTPQEPEANHQDSANKLEIDTIIMPEPEQEFILDKCEASELILDKLPEPEQETETGIVVSDEDKHNLIASQASELGIELSDVEVVDLATSLKDDFLDYESFIDEVVTAVVTYHDHRTDKLQKKIKDAREHIEYRRKQLNRTLVGEFGEMNNFFRQGAAKRRELSKVIAAAFKT
ncbi:MAG: hypothetical protein IGS39_22965 [Calothrix sp. C42_A2020_038]|nr:hypothetical protein [Calothrix sp. C42_A2020_038]